MAGMDVEGLRQATTRALAVTARMLRLPRSREPQDMSRHGQRQSERERKKERQSYIYIYIYIERESERDREGERERERGRVVKHGHARKRGSQLQGIDLDQLAWYMSCRYLDFM